MKLDGCKRGIFLHLGSLSQEPIFDVKLFTEDSDINADEVEVTLSYQKPTYNHLPNILSDCPVTDDI